MFYLPHIQLDPQTPARASVIWLHGLGADGHDFEPLVPELNLPADAGIRFIFPHAPELPVTINGGYIMPAWYDILDMTMERKVDMPQLLASVEAIRRLVDREIERGIDSRNILIAGFSQGGAVGYQVALTYPKPLAGLLALSTYLATADILEPHAANQTLPILVMHGTHDSVVPEALGDKAVKHLRGLGYAPEYKTYPMDHGLCSPQVNDIATWLKARLLG